MEFILKARKALLPGNLILIVLINTFIYKSNQFNLKKNPPNTKFYKDNFLKQFL